MSKQYAGWEQVAIYNPLTGEAVQLVKLTTELCEFTDENVTTQTTIAGFHAGKTFTLRVGFADATILSGDARAKLKEWMENGTLVRAVVHGEASSILWYESVELSYVQGIATDARNGLSIDSVELTKVGVNLQIFEGVNIFELIGAYVTTGSNNTPEYWSLTDFNINGNESWDELNRQLTIPTLSTGIDPSIRIGQTYIEYPVAGVRVVASISLTSSPATLSTLTRANIVSRVFGSTTDVLGPVTAYPSGAPFPWVANCFLDLPSNVWTIALRLNPVQNSIVTPNTFLVRNATLRAGRNAYVNY